MIPTSLSLIALVLRLWGSRQGYPDFYGHVDEIGVAASIWNLFRAGTLEPTEFTYPAFYQYLVAAGIWVSGAVGLPEMPQGGTLMERLVFLSYTDPAWSALVGRVLSALAGAAAVVVVYRLGHRVAGRPVASTAAAAMAVAVVPVTQAHRALPDSTACLLGAVVVTAAFQVCQRGAWRDYVVAGVACGMLLATKYNGALCALCVAVAHLGRRPAPGLGAVARAMIDPRLWCAGLTAVLAAAASSPYLVLAWDRYLNLVQYQVSSLDFTMQQSSPWWWIPRDLVTEEGVVGGLMLAGVAVALWRRDPFDRILLAACLPAFLYIGSWTRESLHYLLPYYPLLAIAGARVVVGSLGRMGVGRTAWVGMGLLLIPNLWIDIGNARAMGRPDVRALAADWVETHVADGSTVAMTWLPYCPRLQQEATRRQILSWYGHRPAWQRQLRERWSDRPAYRVVNLEIWLREPVVPEPMRDLVDLDDPETRRVFSRGWRSLARLRADGVTHIVLPRAVYQRYLVPTEAPADPVARYRLLVNRAYFQRLIDDPSVERLAQIESSEARGSAISIYRLKP